MSHSSPLSRPSKQTRCTRRHWACCRSSMTSFKSLAGLCTALTSCSSCTLSTTWLPVSPVSLELTAWRLGASLPRLMWCPAVPWLASSRAATSSRTPTSWQAAWRHSVSSHDSSLAPLMPTMSPRRRQQQRQRQRHRAAAATAARRTRHLVRWFVAAALPTMTRQRLYQSSCLLYKLPWR